MSRTTTFKLLILQEDEIRIAGLSLAAVEKAHGEGADDKTMTELISAALQACRVALYGITENSTLMLLNRRDLAQGRTENAIVVPKVKP